MLDLLLDFTSNQIISPVLKDLSSGPPKPSESLPERMDGKETVALLQWWFKQLDTGELGVAAAIFFAPAIELQQDKTELMKWLFIVTLAVSSRKSEFTKAIHTSETSFPCPVDKSRQFCMVISFRFFLKHGYYSVA